MEGGAGSPILVDCAVEFHTQKHIYHIFALSWTFLDSLGLSTECVIEQVLVCESTTSSHFVGLSWTILDSLGLSTECVIESIACVQMLQELALTSYWAVCIPYGYAKPRFRIKPSCWLGHSMGKYPIHVEF